nr:MAG TPA: hypothetical protein [Caudoviricetes sp.]
MWRHRTELNKKCPRRLCNKRRGHFAFPAEGESACPHGYRNKKDYKPARPTL